MSDLREVLLSIRSDYGRLTPKIVVDAARPESHPLHTRFEWNDSIAAERHREDQAAELIRSVRVSYTPPDSTISNTIRAFHPTFQPEVGHAYSPVEEIIDDPIARQLLLRDMQRDWMALRKRWENFVEFWETIRGDLENTGS